MFYGGLKKRELLFDLTSVSGSSQSLTIFISQRGKIYTCPLVKQVNFTPQKIHFNNHDFIAVQKSLWFCNMVCILSQHSFPMDLLSFWSVHFPNWSLLTFFESIMNLVMPFLNVLNVYLPFICHITCVRIMPLDF